MISDLTLAELCAATYDPTAKWDESWIGNDLFAGGKLIGDTMVIAFRGTVPTNLANWSRDFDCLPVERAGLGFVFQGFADAEADLAALILPRLAQLGITNIAVTGHSLGGAMAQLFACRLCLAGTPPVTLTTFGTPHIALFGNHRPGGLLSTEPGRDYRHDDDRVPPEPLIGIHPRPVTELGTLRFDLTVLSDHAMLHGYLPALQAINRIAA
jgi:pimeloyl-ACP methyl ester carboxylesterase